METSISRIQWEADGRAAMTRCGGNLKKYEAAFREVRAERVARELDQQQQIHTHTRQVQSTGVKSYSAAQRKVIGDDLNKYAMSSVTSLLRLAGILVSLRDDDGKIDRELAVGLLSKLPDDVQAAAGQRIDELAHTALLNTTGAIDSARLQQSMNVVRREFPALANASDNGSVSGALLDVLFWPQSHVFKNGSAAPQEFSHGNEVRKYSSDANHVSYDRAGNEIRSYSFAMSK